jgi:glycosyltransferase involved in cell wall biosynthesis
MPAYNCADTVAVAANSILTQTFEDFEFIIVDDGSTDETGRILDGIAARDPRVRVLHNPHSGIVGALNAGLAECRGEFIARMDADDVSLPRRLARQIDFMRSAPTVAVCGAGCMRDNGILKLIPGLMSAPMSTMVNGLPIVHPTMMFRTAALDAHGLKYDPEYEFAEDYKLIFEMMKLGLLAYNLPDVLLVYNRTSDSITQKNSDHYKIAEKVHLEIIEWLRWHNIPIPHIYNEWFCRFKKTES